MDIYNPTAKPSADLLEDGQYWNWNAYVSPPAWCIRTNAVDESKAWAWYVNRARQRAEDRAMSKVFVVEVPKPEPVVMPAPTGEPVADLPAPV